MEKMDEIKQARVIASAIVGSARYGYASAESDRDYFFLTRDTDIAYHDSELNASYYLWSVQHVKDSLGHPMLLGNLTADCSGNKRLITFLLEHRRELAYTDPMRTVSIGIEYIGAKESIGIDTAVKPALLTAFILSHMAAESEDPFLLSDEEKAILIRARTGEVDSEERTELYRQTLCPENLETLRKMPENVTLKNELFALLDDIVEKEEFL